MTKLSHQFLGACGSLLAFSLTGNLFLSTAFYFGSVFPDVDVLWNDFKSYQTKWYSHRGFTHSLLIPTFLLTVSLLLLVLKVPHSSLLLSFGLGVLFHDLLDAMSPTGIPLKLSYYPRFRLWTVYRNRTVSEGIVVFLFSTLLLTVSLLLLHNNKTVSKTLDNLTNNSYIAEVERFWR